MGEKEVKKALQHPDKYGAGAEKRKSLNKADTKSAVFKEYGQGTLHAGGSGKKVTSKAQATAIAISESEKKKK